MLGAVVCKMIGLASIASMQRIRAGVTHAEATRVRDPICSRRRLVSAPSADRRGRASRYRTDPHGTVESLSHAVADATAVLCTLMQRACTTVPADGLYYVPF